MFVTNVYTMMDLNDQNWCIMGQVWGVAELNTAISQD